MVRTGNIVSFLAPTKISIENNEVIESSESINFAIEIPDIDNFGAVSFQYLFHMQIGIILSNYIKNAEIQLEGNNILYITNSQNTDYKNISNTLIKRDGDSILLFYTINLGDVNNSYKGKVSLPIDEDSGEELTIKFMNDVIEYFNHISKFMFHKCRLIKN